MTFARQPVLAGARLTLRPLAEADWKSFLELGGDRQLWAFHPDRERWKPAKLRAFFEAGLARGGALAITETGSGRMLGSSQFGMPDHPSTGEIEIGWTFLARAEQAKGYNALAKSLMLAHALGYFEQVVFQVGERNIPSRRAMLAIGGELTGRTRRYELGGEIHTNLYYAITREGFATGPLQGLCG